MSYAMTFGSLKDDLRRYLERGFTEADDPIVYEQLPRLITLAERRISRELKVQGFIRAVVTAVIANQSVYTKPDRWRDTISIFVNKSPVFARSLEYCKSYWPDSSETGQPQFYADYDYTRWLLVPTPTADQTMEVVYYEQPPLLDDSTQTNWLTDYAPNALLYAALLEATPFLKNDERIQVWQGMYDRAAQTLNGEDLMKILDRSAQRTEA